MAAENPNFSARPGQVEGELKSLTLAFRKCCDHNRILRKTNQLTFPCNRLQAHQNVQDTRNNYLFGEQKTHLFRNVLLFWNIPIEHALSLLF